MFKTNIMKNC